MYVCGTLEFGIWYPHDTIVKFVGYFDVDWAGCNNDPKSTSSGLFYLENSVISWHSKKKSLVSLSTVEVEYIVIGFCCSQLLGMKKMHTEYGI